MRPSLVAASSLSSTSIRVQIPRRVLSFSLPLQPQLRQFSSKKTTTHKKSHSPRVPSIKGTKMSQSIYIDETPADVKNAKV